MNKISKLIISLTLCSLLVCGCANKARKESFNSEIAVSGKIISVNESSLVIKVLTGINADNAVVIINKDTIYNKDISNEFTKDNIIVFNISKRIIDSEVITLIAKKIISNKPL